MNSLDALIEGPPIPHNGTNGATTFGTNVTSISATSCASYTTTGSGGGTTDPSNTNTAGFRFATVHNLDATKYLYVNVGNTAKLPPTPGAGCFAVPPNTRYRFTIPGLGAVPGVNGYLKILASGSNTAGSVQWHP